MKTPAHIRLWRGFGLTLLILIFSQLLFFTLVPRAYAAPTPAPTPGGNWQRDQVVENVGKGAERARELVFWVFSHPPRNRAPVLARLWSYSRNIVYVFFVLVLAVGGIGFIVAKRQGAIGPIFSGVSSPFFGFEVPSFILKVALLLLYVTFSYVFVLGLMEFAQILMNFFIQTLGGCNLFNINFGKATECLVVGEDRASLAKYREQIMMMEKNYTDFTGWREMSKGNQEMANTSLFFVQLTSLTYNAMSIMLILRDVILWFLLIVSPFLALLMPFVFIRNIGWIWIGVFLQWLFYGPLFALFILALVKIWQAGIPYGFDFSRTPENAPADYAVCYNPPYHTAINILWGGPAQTLSQCNSANYVDTYAEYVIALVMLWGTLLLPWLLLRIFRDYCCDILRQNQATLQAILNRLRVAVPLGMLPGGPLAAAPVPGAAGEEDVRRLELPFRRVREGERKTTQGEERKLALENLRDIGALKTSEVSKMLDISLDKLRDIAKLETNTVRRQEVQDRLNKLANPAQIPRMEERQQYAQLRSELMSRAARGDKAAARLLLSASQPKPQTVLRQIRTAAATPQEQISREMQRAARSARVTEQKVAQVVGMYQSIATKPRTEQVQQVAQQAQLSTQQAERVLADILPTSAVSEQIQEIAKENDVSEQQVARVVGMMTKIKQLSKEEQQRSIMEETKLTGEQAERVMSAVAPLPTVAQQITEIAKEANVSEQDVARVVGMMPAISQMTQEEQLKEVTKDTDLTEQQAVQVLGMLAPATQFTKQIQEIAQESGVSEQEVAQVVGMMSQMSTLPENEQEKAIVEGTKLTEEEAERLLAALAPSAPIISQIRQLAEQVQVPEAAIMQVVGMLPDLAGLSSKEQIEAVVQQTGLEEEQAGQILSIIAPVSPLMAFVNEVMQKTSAPEQQVEEVIGILPTISTLSTEQQIQEVTKLTGLSDEEAEEVLTALTKAEKRPRAVLGRVKRDLPKVVSASQIRQTAQKAGVAEEAVVQVVRLLPSLTKLSSQEQVIEVAKKTKLTEVEAEKVLTALVETSPVRKEEGKEEMPQVTVEDYEEVRKMWVHHYRSTVVPKSGKISSRKDWVEEDAKRIINALNLLEARESELHEEGLKEVEKILPFMLLGGFTDEEIIIYLKAKLEAAKQVLQELLSAKKLQAEEAAPPEELVAVSPAESEKEKEEELARAQELPLAEGKEDTNNAGVTAGKDKDTEQ